MPRGELRRKDRAMCDEDCWRLLERAFCGRLGTADADGWPYIVPKLFVVDGASIYFHGATARGHMQANLEDNPRVCFEVDEPGPVFPSGEGSQCDTSNAFQSVIVFGTCSLVEDHEQKLRALRLLMRKYADPAWERPDTFPSLDETAVYEVAVERMTGKRRSLAVAGQQQDTSPRSGRLP